MVLNGTLRLAAVQQVHLQAPHQTAIPVRQRLQQLALRPLHKQQRSSQQPVTLLQLSEPITKGARSTTMPRSPSTGKLGYVTWQLVVLNGMLKSVVQRPLLRQVPPTLARHLLRREPTLSKQPLISELLRA